MKEDNLPPPYAPVLIKLLQGVIYNDSTDYWNTLINFQKEIHEYFSTIGVEVHIFENEGFAFLKQKLADEDIDIPLPALMIKRQFNYHITLLCVLLVEILIEFDVSGGDSNRLILGREEIKDMVKIFLPEKTNEAKALDNIDTSINKIVEYGFLRKLKGKDVKFEVKRILKAKITADTLQEIKERLLDHAKSNV